MSFSKRSLVFYCSCMTSVVLLGLSKDRWFLCVASRVQLRLVVAGGR